MRFAENGVSPLPLQQDRQHLPPASLKDEANYEEGRDGSIGTETGFQRQNSQPMEVAPSFDVRMEEDEPLSGTYQEERAFESQNPPFPVEGEDIPGAKATKDLPPLLPPPELPEHPKTGKCEWSFDPETRVLLANFRQENRQVEVDSQDLQHLLEMMERDDITCISEGLAGLDYDSYKADTIFNECGTEFFHKFRQFDLEEQQNTGTTNKVRPGTRRPTLLVSTLILSFPARCRVL